MPRSFKKFFPKYPPSTRAPNLYKVRANDPQEASKVSKQTNPVSPPQNSYKPTSFIEKTCFSCSTGLLLTREECEVNIARELKNLKKIDYYELLELSTKEGIAGTIHEKILKTLAFQCVMLNELLEKRQKLSAFNRDASNNTNTSP